MIMRVLLRVNDVMFYSHKHLETFTDEASDGLER